MITPQAVGCQARFSSRLRAPPVASGGVSGAMVQETLVANETQTRNQAKIKRAYDYIVIGSGASGAIIAGELSKTGADVLVVEAGGEDTGATITDPSIWFYNVGSA